MNSRNHMKMQKIVRFVKINLNENMLKVKNIRDLCDYTGEYRSAAHSICNLKYSVPKDIPIVFPILFKGSNYDYNFIIKERA